MKRIVICMLAGVLFAGSVLVVGKVQGMNNEETQESQSQSEENIRQEAQEPDSVFETEVEEKVAIETDTQTEVEIEQITQTEETEPAAKAPTKAKAKAKAEASAQMKAEEAKMSDETLIQEESPSENAVVEVNRRYIEDCGSDSGYWEITYSDGHIEYLDE